MGSHPPFINTFCKIPDFFLFPWIINLGGKELKVIGKCIQQYTDKPCTSIAGFHRVMYAFSPEGVEREGGIERKSMLFQLGG